MTTAKTLTVALVLTALPAASFAMGCKHGQYDKQQAQSCAPGMLYDATAGACLPVTSS